MKTHRISYVALADAQLPLMVDRNRAYSGKGPMPEAAASYRIYDSRGREIREASSYGYRKNAEHAAAQMTKQLAN